MTTRARRRRRLGPYIVAAGSLLVYVVLAAFIGYVFAIGIITIAMVLR